MGLKGGVIAMVLEAIVVSMAHRFYLWVSLCPIPGVRCNIPGIRTLHSGTFVVYPQKDPLFYTHYITTPYIKDGILYVFFLINSSRSKIFYF